MRKLFLLLCFVCSMESSFLYSMLSVNNNANIVLEIVAHNLPHDDYDVHRTCARLSTVCNKAIENSYRKDKKRIEFLMHEQNIIPGEISWNKDFSRCAWINAVENHKLNITVLGLNDNNKLRTKLCSWDNFGGLLNGRKKPFFDQQGMACIHGYGWINVPGAGSCGNVVKYACGFEAQEALRCVLASDKVEALGLIAFLDFPIFLRAILNSKRSEKQIRKHQRGYILFLEPVQLYYVENAVFPDNYKELVVFNSNRGAYYESFDKVFSENSIDLKNAIEARYAEQQQEKGGSKK